MEASILTNVNLTSIIMDKQTQPRAELDEHTINEYRLDMLDGANFPPLIVFADGDEKYYLADGWHRCTAAKQINPEGSIECAIYHGDLRDAILYSCSANYDQGKRRGDGDKKRAIRKLLKDPEWSVWSDNKILKQCKVSGGYWFSYISTERKNLSSPKGEDRKVERGGTTYTINTASIGKKSEPEPTPQADLFSTRSAVANLSGPKGPDRKADTPEPEPEPTPELPAPRFDPLNYWLYTTPIEKLSEHVGENSINAIITDPPYPKKYIPTYKELARQAAIVLKPNGILVALCGHNYIAKLISDMSEHLHYHWLGCYYMPTGKHASLPVYSVSVYWKPLLIFSKGKWPKTRVFKDVFINDDADKQYHTWGQGVTGFTRLVEAFTFPNETVLDPFVGGGTTAIAALSVGRYFVGADISTEEIAKTKKRIEETQ